MMDEQDNKRFLEPGEYVDSGHPSIVTFAQEKAAATSTSLDRGLALYRAVRDGIKYDPYLDYTDASIFRASGVLAAKKGFCVGKAALLAACCRAVGIPARVGYADVRNHMTSPRLHALTETDVFCWHSYTEIKLAGKWVKATPAFDATLCGRLGISPLEFDGRSDSLFQACDAEGQRRMEYLSDRGVFADVPIDRILGDFRVRYPKMISAGAVSGDFLAEARTEQ